MTSYWRRKELPFLILYAVAFYAIIIRRAVQLSRGTQILFLFRCIITTSYMECVADGLLIDSM
nr:putative membrane-bound O-acyltransferase C24H6.01C isoform X1 [Ipomoea batatas]